MNRKPLYQPNLEARKIYQVSKNCNQPLKTLPSTAVHSKETKKRTTSTFNGIGGEQPTRKQIPLFSYQQLLDDNNSVPYAKDMIRHIKDIEHEFITKVSRQSPSLYSLCRVRYIKRLKEAKVAFNLQTETVFLAVHIYDKYLEVEETRKDTLSSITWDSKALQLAGYVSVDGYIISTLGKKNKRN